MSSKPQKDGNQDKTLKTIILITASITLIDKIIDLIQRFID